MLLIPCPHCGPRNEGEFSYGGPRCALPALDADIKTWRDALFAGRNPRGAVVELWFHTSGCEAWVEVTRDTATHEILSATTPHVRAKSS